MHASLCLSEQRYYCEIATASVNGAWLDDNVVIVRHGPASVMEPGCMAFLTVRQVLCLDHLAEKCLPMQIIEFGTGDGLPVIHAMETWHKFGGVVHGFEINPSAASVAQHNAAAHGVSKQYKVRLSCISQQTHRQHLTSVW